MIRVSLLADCVAGLVAGGYIVARLLRYRRIRIDHRLIFCVGHLYYMTLGSLMVHARALPQYYVNVYRFFDEVSPQRRALGSIWSLLALLAFLGGCALVRPRSTPAGVLPTQRAPTSLMLAPAIALTVALLGMFAVVAVVFRSTILSGYSSADPQVIQQQSGRGVLAASAVAVVGTALFTRELARRTSPGNRLLRDTLCATAVAFPAATLLIGGGRMYVATIVIGAIVWLTHLRRPIRRAVLLAASAGGFVLLVALGALRVGELPSGETGVLYATSESVLTTVSYARFLDSPREVFLPVRFPRYLVTDLVNVVPRVVLPTKDSLRADPESDGFTVTSSLGALQLSVSALINFGFVGSLAVLAAAGNALSRLQRRLMTQPTMLRAIAYPTITAALAFSLFRDPFGISIVRWVLVSGILTPLACSAAVRVFQRRPTVLAPRRPVSPTV